MFINGISFILSIDKGKAKIDKTYDFSAENLENSSSTSPFRFEFLWNLFTRFTFEKKADKEERAKTLDIFNFSSHHIDDNI